MDAGDQWLLATRGQQHTNCYDPIAVAVTGKTTLIWSFAITFLIITSLYTVQLQSLAETHNAFPNIIIHETHVY